MFIKNLQFKNFKRFSDLEISLDGVNILTSDQFEVYYPYFDVKKYFTDKPNFNLEKLTQTKWFKDQIKNIIEN